MEKQVRCITQDSENKVVSINGSQWIMRRDGDGLPVATKVYPACQNAPDGAHCTAPAKGRPGFRIAYFWPILLVVACVAVYPYAMRVLEAGNALLGY